MLIFMDIDATMIKTQRAGLKAMVQAGRELIGEAFTADGVEFAGRLDPLILADMLRRAGREPCTATMRAIREAYAKALGEHLGPGVGIVLPGVAALLRDLSERSVAGELALGVLTGNFEETGCLKLRACGIDPGIFQIRVWGDDSPHDPPSRDHLPPIGFRRYRERFGRAITPSRVTIVGDTPHDVACARAHGCRALGVATGQYSIDELHAAGADHVVPTLAETSEIVAWMLR